MSNLIKLNIIFVLLILINGRKNIIKIDYNIS